MNFLYLIMNVSCDKIRIKYRLQKYIQFEVPFDKLPTGYIKSYDCKGLNNNYQKNNIGKYLYSFWFALQEWETNIICFQGQVLSDAIDEKVFVIEYNPNKHKLPFFVTDFLKNTGAYINQILSCDICYDFKNLPVSEFSFDANGHCQTMTYGTVGGSVAKYLSPKAKDGRIKVYDKEVERRGKDDHELYKGVTRVEVSYKSVSFVLDYLKHDIELFDDDVIRVKSMLECLQRVKYPSYYDITPVDDKRLNPGILKALRQYLDSMDLTGAKEFIRLCFKSKASRVPYNEFIKKYDGITCLYDSSGYLSFFDDFCFAINDALPNLS